MTRGRTLARPQALGDGGGVAMAELLRASASLRSLWLQSCRIGTAGAEALATALCACSLTSLHLDGNELIADAGAVALAAGNAQGSLQVRHRQAVIPLTAPI